MKKILLCVSVLFFLQFIIVKAESIEPISISTEDVYKYGNNFSLSWGPSDVGVASIEIVPINNGKGGLYVYGPKVFGDPVNYDGFFSYDLPNYIFTPEGKYKAKLTTKDGSIVYSESFSIEDEYDDGFDEIEDSEYRIGEINVKDEYLIEEDITIWVQGLEKDNIVATPTNGFNIQAVLYSKSDVNSKRGLSSANAVYDAPSKRWIINMESPDKVGKYVAEIILYCSNLNSTSYCANKYGSTSYDDQTSDRVSFKVVQKLDNDDSSNDFSYLFNKYGDIKFLNPEEGGNKVQELVAGQQYVIKWKNIIGYADWSVALHKFEKNVSKTTLSNGAPDYAGIRIADLGSASIGQTELKVTLPSNLEPGYYYFNFGGKAAYDNSPAIKIVSNQDQENDDLNFDTNDSHTSDTAILKLVINILKADNSSNNAQLVKILELVISLLEK